MEYRSFDEVDPPHLTVTEANPAHWLDFRRFSSDQVVAFNRAQVDILRECSPGRDVTHNLMGFFTEFDHHDLGRDLDIATWDSYPLGFLEQFFPEADRQAYLRQGHPDIAAFHHDLYRGCSAGRWGVMEQQPGPVNWARYNPAPLPGMVGLWTLEACAHGAEFVSYFRWRQAPFAQEQMHAGLLRPDRVDAPAAEEAREAADILSKIGEQRTTQAPVALVFSYEAAWVCGIQPQGKSFRYLDLAFEWYSALRRQGLDVDIVAPDTDLSAYSMVLAPTLPIMPDGFLEKLAELSCPVLFGPRSGSKTASFAIPPNLAPGKLAELIPIAVTRVESLRNGEVIEGNGWSASRWREDIESEIAPEMTDSDGRGVIYVKDNIRYCSVWPDTALLEQLIARMAKEAGVKLARLPEGLRVRRSATYIFAFNYTTASIDTADLGFGKPVHGTTNIAPAGVTIWARA